MWRNYRNLPVNATGLLLTQPDTRCTLMGTLVNMALHHFDLL